MHSNAHPLLGLREILKKCAGDTSFSLLQRVPWVEVNAVDAYVNTVYDRHEDTETSAGRPNYTGDAFA